MTVTRNPASPEIKNGAFVRQENAFRNRITADGSSGYKAEPGRYHLYVSLACPWAHRAMIVRKLLKLEDVITMSVVNPIRDERGWAFGDGPGFSEDPIRGFEFLSEAYLATDPDYQGRWTVPAVWDRATEAIVTNDYPVITTQLGTEFVDFAEPGVDLYPEALRPEIDRLGEELFENVNNGVYKAGFATTQRAYEEAFDALFKTLDDLERRLSTRRYLVGHQLTEADIKLFPTLVRFDAVYFGHFKCNLRRLVDYPNLWGYTRDLYSRPGFGDTVDFDHIKRHYYATHDNINPTRIVPKGPDLDWTAPHKRDTLP
ncbi:MAG: glutathione S-transferase family protein [Actinobacteria bacterium]|nr:glutathione S-transferase family protein [Actinomycetota bacterium]